MAQYQLNEPEDLIECPYNSSHLVRALRFPYHLIKCRKNNPNMEYAVCPFNARHEMPYAELRYHIARCIDRTVLEHDIARAQTCASDTGHIKGNTSVPAYSDSSDTAPTEDWDTESRTNPRLQSYTESRNTRLPRDRGERGAREASAAELRMDPEGESWADLVGHHIHNDRISYEEIHTKQPIKSHDNVPTRQPHGLPAVLQMAQQSRLCSIETQGVKCAPSTDDVNVATATTATLSCDNPRKPLLQSLARGRGISVPSVGCAARQLTSAQGWGRGVILNVGRGVMCLSQLPHT